MIPAVDPAGHSGAAAPAAYPAQPASAAARPDAEPGARPGTADRLARWDLRLIIVTDRHQAARPLVDVIAAALDAGARTVLLREKDLPRRQRLILAGRLRALGADVIVGGTDPLHGNAIHLAAADPAPIGLGTDLLIGRSCHSRAETEALTTEDYCTLSPIFESGSKPGYGPPLGVGALRARIIALGGVDTPRRALACREAGATGVAVMGAVMRAGDPARVVKGLLP